MRSCPERSCTLSEAVTESKGSGVEGQRSRRVAESKGSGVEGPSPFLSSKRTTVLPRWSVRRYWNRYFQSRPHSLSRRHGANLRNFGDFPVHISLILPILWQTASLLLNIEPACWCSAAGRFYHVVIGTIIRISNTD